MRLTEKLTDFFKRGRSVEALAIESENNSRDVRPAAPQSKKAEKVYPDRISRDKLEHIYMNDGIAFSAINTIVETFMSADFDIDVDDNDREVLDQILDSSGFNHLLMKIVQDLCIYGNSFVEVVRNGDNDIVGLEWIDAKSVDFLRDSNNNIKFDDYQQPEGYIQFLPHDFDMSRIPKNRRIRQDGKAGIKFSPDEILHLSLYNVGDSPIGVGLLEPLFKEFKIKMNVEHAFGEYMYRKGHPIAIATVGNENHPPSPNDIDHMKDIMEDFSSNDQIVMPYYMELDYLEPSHPESIYQTMEYYVDLILSGIGIPKPYVTGLGGDANRSALERQAIIFERRITMLQKIVTKELEDSVFSIIYEERDFTRVPEIQFEQVSTEDLTEKAGRLSEYAGSGLIRPTKSIREKILEKENLK